MPAMETLRNGKRKAVLEALKAGNTRRAACLAAGIVPDTFYRWINEDRTLSDAVKEAEAEAERFFVEKIKQASCESWQAAAWWLERRKASDFARKDTVTVLQKLAKDVQNLSDEQLIALASSGDGDDSDPSSGAGGTGA